MYTAHNYKTKKELKVDVARINEIGLIPNPISESELRELRRLKNRLQAYQPGGIFPGTTNGTAVIEGPHYPQPHRWYASVIIEDGIVTKVK